MQIKNWFRKLFGKPTVEDIKTIAVPSGLTQSQLEIVEVGVGSGETPSHHAWVDGAYKKVPNA